MRDPHVEKLVYKLNQDEVVNYKDPKPVEKELDDFRIKLVDGILNIKMKNHCSSVNEARQVVEPFLRAWETDAFLKSGNNNFHFEFNDSNVIDRDPPGQEETVISIKDMSAQVSMSATMVTISYQNYPQPPTYVELSPDAESLASRYRNYRNDKELLVNVAYFCKTLIESRPNKIVSNKILSNLGNFSTHRSDENRARKYKLPKKKLSSKERAWLDSAIKKVVIQVATVDVGKEQSKLTMADLPSL